MIKTDAVDVISLCGAAETEERIEEQKKSRGFQNRGIHIWESEEEREAR